MPSPVAIAFSKNDNYVPSLYQALRDVTAWVEDGDAPPCSTRYDIGDSQIEVPRNAAARRGIQPVVDLTANGNTRIDVVAGQPVSFRARIQVPPQAGRVVATDWDLAGTGNFTPSDFGRPRQTVVVRTTFTYTTPGTYFPVLRVASQRDGEPTDPTPGSRTSPECVSSCARSSDVG